jgi:ParB family chromosome partitioning protein
VQPIVARPLKKKNGKAQRYEIVAGERRWRAAQMAGLAEIPTVIRDLDDDAAIATALIENIQRENLNPLEEARALDRLISEFDLTHQEAAEAVGRSRAGVSNLLRLLDLSDKVKPMLESRQLEMGHARALLSISSKTQQFDAARQVVKKGLSVRETEQLVRRVLANQEGKKRKTGSGKPGGQEKKNDQRRSECGYSQARSRYLRQARCQSPYRAYEERHRQSRYQLQQPRRTRRHPQAHQIIK